MRTYLIDPNLRWCKANLHCHSTYSDGFYSREKIKEMYVKNGYQIVAFSDHEVFFDSSYLCDDEFVALTAAEYSINDTKPFYTSYCSLDNHIPYRDFKTIHLNFFAKDPHNTFHFATNIERIEPKPLKLMGGKENFKCDGYNRKFTQESIQETINRGVKCGFLAQFNHPNWSLNTREDYINLKNLWALEIYNYGSDQETSADYCINIYDDMARSGHKLCCTMGDDNHNNPNGSLDDSFGGFNYIGVNKLTYQDVIKAMEDGNIYASNGPIIKALYIDHDIGKIIVECSEAIDIIFTACNRTFRHYHGDNLTTADFKIFEGDIYFRITIKDKNGKVAHTRFYYLSDYGY